MYIVIIAIGIVYLRWIVIGVDENRGQSPLEIVVFSKELVELVGPVLLGDPRIRLITNSLSLYFE